MRNFLLKNYKVSLQFVKDKTITPIISYFKQGLDPKKLSHSVASGIIIGSIPVIGVSSVMATFVGLRCRLFTALIILITYLIYPLQVLLILPFMKLGGLMMGKNVGAINVSAIFSKLFKHPISSLPEFGTLILGGILAWAIASIGVYIGIYYLTIFLLKKDKHRWTWYTDRLRPRVVAIGKYLNPKNYFIS